MTTRTLDHHPVGEDAEDLRTWVHGLQGCPPVAHVVPVACAAPAHGAERATWFYVESSPTEALARLRCVGCGRVADVFDSAAHWTYPPMHACAGCQQSMLEVAVGVATEPVDAPPAGPPAEVVTWAVVAARCVTCGWLQGLTDMYVDRAPLDVATAGLHPA